MSSCLLPLPCFVLFYLLKPNEAIRVRLVQSSQRLVFCYIALVLGFYLWYSGANSETLCSGVLRGGPRHQTRVDDTQCKYHLSCPISLATTHHADFCSHQLFQEPSTSQRKVFLNSLARRDGLAHLLPPSPNRTQLLYKIHKFLAGKKSSHGRNRCSKTNFCHDTVPNIIVLKCGEKGWWC